MAESGKVKKSDVFEDGIADDQIKDFTSLNKVLTKTADRYLDILEAQQKILNLGKGNIKTIEEVEKINKGIEESKKARIAYNAVIKTQIDLQIKEERLKQAQIKTQKDATAVADKAARAARKQAKEVEALNSEYKKGTARLNDVKKALKELEFTGRTNGKLYKGLREEFAELDTKVRATEESVGEFNRSVGNYTGGIQDAVEESGLFSEQLSKLNGIYKILKQQQEGNTTATNKWSTALKGLGILALLALLGGIKNAFSASTDGADKLEIATAKLTARTNSVASSIGNATLAMINQSIAQFKLFTGIGDQVKAQGELIESMIDYNDATTGVIDKQDAAAESAEKLTIATQKYRHELRELQKTQQQFALDEEDQVEISNDVTRGFEQRNEALEESFRLERKKLETEKAIADKELQFANERIALKLKENGITQELSEKELTNINTNAELKDKANVELLDAQNEAIKAQVAAADKIDDLQRQQDQRSRERLEKQLAQDIQLLRSKKNSTQLLSEQLQKQIDDERKQIADRQVLAEEQLKNERAVTDDIINRIKEVAEAEAKSAGVAAPLIDKENLLLEGNAELLSEKIKALNLSEALTIELASAIKKAQEAELKGQENLKKLQEERIKRDQKILQLQKEIAQQQTKADLDALNDLEEEKQKQFEKANEKILQQENAFSAKKLAARKKLFDQTQELERQDFNIREDLLRQQSILELDAIDKSNEQNEVKAEQRRKVEEKLTQDLEALDRERAAKAVENIDKEKERIRQIEIRQTEIVVENLQKVTSALADELEKRHDLQLEQADKELTDREKAVERQAALAEQGLQNQYAFEIAAQEQAELKKKEIEEKAQREEEILQLTDAYFNALNARLKEPGADPNNAAYLALGDVLLARGVAKGIVQFAADGNNMIEGPGTTTSDSIPFMLSKKEAVIKASENIKHNDAVVALNAGLFDQMYMPRVEASDYSKSDNSLLNRQALSIFAGMKEDLAEIRDKPAEHWDLNIYNQWVKTQIAKGHKRRTTYVEPRNFHT